MLSLTYLEDKYQIEFDSKIDLKERVDDFVRLDESNFLFLKLDSKDKFQIKSLKGGEVEESYGPVINILKSLSENLTLKNGKDIYL